MQRAAYKEIVVQGHRQESVIKKHAFNYMLFNHTFFIGSQITANHTGRR